MSLVQKPTLQSYWSTDRSIETPYFKTARFVSISRNLHFANNVLLQPDDPLRKIRPIIDTIRKAFQEEYTPSKDVSLDESLVKCRVHSIQYNKFGIKFYKLCEQNIYIVLGYMCRKG